MISYHDGDILESGVPVICQQVNCMGVMGAGLAKQIRNKWPHIYDRYCEFVKGRKRTGEVLLGWTLWTSINRDTDLPFVANFFSQDGYGHGKVYTEYSALRRCLEDTKMICEQTYENCTIAIPDHIGCGLAGGDWGVVHKMICDVFADYTGDVQIWKLN